MKGYALFYYNNTKCGIVKLYFNSLVDKTWGLATNTTFKSVTECIDVYNRFNLQKSVPIGSLIRISGPKGGVYDLKGRLVK